MGGTREDATRGLRRLHLYIAICLCLLFVLSACTPEPTPPPSSPAVPTAETQRPLETAAPTYPWTDENAVMGGICFEAALDAAGQVFVLRSADDHIRFYELADASQLCRRPVARTPFDFSSGRILAGVWSAGVGCRARHDVLEIARDDTARIFTLRLRFVIDGGCNYELVRPFWIGLDGLAGYEVRVNIVDS